VTAYRAFKACKSSGIKLAADGNNLRWSAPTAKAMTPPLKAEMVRVKPELLAVLSGDYAEAGKQLVLRETQPGEQRRALVEMFDKRVAVGMTEGRLNYGSGCKVAYIAIAKEIERINVEAMAGIRDNPYKALTSFGLNAILR